MARKQYISRRNFIKGAGAAAISFTVAKSHIAKTYAANEKIAIGIIGCGDRGHWVGNLLKENGGYHIAGCADYFQDRVDNLGTAFNIPPENRHINLSCYKKLLAQKIDAVAVLSPPYFHPTQAVAAIDAGKHVYVAKPVAVDVPGCKTIEATGQKATANKLCFLVDFQTRADQYYIEAVKRVHAGALGDLAFGESMYHSNRLGVKAKPGTEGARLRNWVFDKALSGDIITEQNIHTLDVMSWIMNTEPLSAVGTAGRKVRTDVGDCRDYFVLTFEYPDNVAIAFTSRQFNGHGTLPDGIRNRMFGSKGVLEAVYGGRTFIRGRKENSYKGGTSPGIYKEGVATNIATFRKNITEGNVTNPTVAPSVQSNLITILGRMAADTGKKVTWPEVLKNNNKLNPNLKAEGYKP